MNRTIFYAWQSDSPNKTNRGLIGHALEKAAKMLRPQLLTGDSLDVHEAARGRPGSPDIAAVIFERIKEATAVVADITFIGQLDGRAVPNPNVLVEVGYALGSLSEDRVVLVQNTAQLPTSSLPFDIRNRQVLHYSAREEDKPAAARMLLTSKLTSALGAILEHDRALGDSEFPFALTVREGTHGTHKLVCELTNKSERRLDDWELALAMPTAPFAATGVSHGCHNGRRSNAQTSYFTIGHKNHSEPHVAVGDSRQLGAGYVVSDRVLERAPGLPDQVVTATLSVDGKVIRRIERRFGDLHDVDDEADKR